MTTARIGGSSGRVRDVAERGAVAPDPGDAVQVVFRPRVALPEALEERLLAPQLPGERRVDLPVSLLVRVVPQPVVAMGPVLPPGVVQDRVEADPLDPDAGREGQADFQAD